MDEDRLEPQSEADQELVHRRQLAINVVLFLLFAVCVLHQVYTAWREQRLDYVEIAFALQNVIMVVFILIRVDAKAIDRSYLHQMVAVIAFMSGVVIMGQPQTGGPTARTVSEVVTFLANVLGAFTLLNLGRSFGILIAFRKIKTSWLYSVVRHPMYGTDLLLRIGFVISHFSIFTVSVCISTAAIYIYRAMLEERFLSQQPEYREYMKRVRYRFIPYVF